MSHGNLWLQEAVSAGRMLKIEKGARSGGVSDNEHIVRIRGWLLAYLTAEEQQALCCLWMFTGGFELATAQACWAAVSLELWRGYCVA